MVRVCASRPNQSKPITLGPGSPGPAEFSLREPLTRARFPPRVSAGLSDSKGTSQQTFFSWRYL